MRRNLTDWRNLVDGQLDAVLTADALHALLNETAEDLSILQSVPIMVDVPEAHLPADLPLSHQEVQDTLAAFLPSRNSKATATATETLAALRQLQARQRKLTREWHENMGNGTVVRPSSTT